MEAFPIDPAAPGGDPVDTSPYLMWVIRMYVKDVRARAKQGRWLPVTDAQIMAASNKTFDSIRMAREHNRADPTAADTAVTDYTLVWVREVIVDVDGDDLIYYTLGDSGLLSEPAPLQTVYTQGRPFVVGHVIIEAHRAYPSGIPRGYM